VNKRQKRRAEWIKIRTEGTKQETVEVQLTRLGLDWLAAPLVCRQFLVFHPPFVQTLGLVYADGAGAEHLAADVAVDGRRHLRRGAAAAAAAACVLLFLLTPSPDFSPSISHSSTPVTDPPQQCFPEFLIANPLSASKKKFGSSHLSSCRYRVSYNCNPKFKIVISELMFDCCGYITVA
jgi:hypothetical protein